MDRDALLVLLVGGVLLNFGLLALVALLRAAPWRVPAESRATTARPDSVIPLGWAPAAPRHAALRPVEPGPVVTATSIVAPLAVQAASSAAVAPKLAVSVEPSVAPEPPAPAPSSSPVATEQPARRPAPVTKPARRGRRFTMPDLEEDYDRAARSIAAFLGEPVAPAGGPRPHRRRHRARRRAGSAARTDLILAIAGESLPGRAPHAVAAALRETVRESDEVVEVPGGRLRVTLDADPVGSQAFVTRARGVVQPWLELLGPNVELLVEDPTAAPPAASAAS